MAPRPVNLEALEAEIDRLRSLGLDKLRTLWRTMLRSSPPPALTKDLMARMIAWDIQEQALGGLDAATRTLLQGLARGQKPEGRRRLKPGAVLVREYQGERHTITVIPGGFVWREATYASLSTIARAITGTAWNGPRFFGVRGPGNPADEHDFAPVKPTEAPRKHGAGRFAGGASMGRREASR